MIFISYRISDAQHLVGRLYADLCREFGADFVFRDRSRLEGGQNWTRVLEESAENCCVMLVVMGETWQGSSFPDGDWKGVPRLWHPEDWVRKEITLALDASRTIIPVFLTGGEMPPAGWLKNCGLDRLGERQGVQLRTDEYDDDLPKLITAIRNRCPSLQSSAAGTTPPSSLRRLPSPPNYFAVPEYVLTTTFIGRATELDHLDAWAKSGDPLMLIEGIGGLGKSALAWEWMQKRATYAIRGLAGRVWWSFYEKGTNMAAFVRHALAYCTGRDPDILGKEMSPYQCSQELLTELRRRPTLLVLDGFERVLTAYHRWDKAQQRDDKIDGSLRECIDPKDGELLLQLLHAGQSKILLSTRLFPYVLEERSTGRPIPGVAHHRLQGLSRSDALAFFRKARIQGNEQAMLEFAEKFDRHSLLLSVICGEIAGYPRRPYHFDAWQADSDYGGKLKLSDLDLRQRYSHILRFALDGLDEQKRRLLCRIAVLSENAAYETIAVVNPYLPMRSPKLEKPSNPKQGYGWGKLDPDEQRKRLAIYDHAQEAYQPRQQAAQAYHDSIEYKNSRLAFDTSLKELQDRGLLQWDRHAGRYDMHPVVRGYAAELLEEDERKSTLLAVHDHFAALPPDDFKNATEISDLAKSIEIYRCLLGAGLLDEAADFYRGDLSDTLFFHLGAHHLIIELIAPLFQGGQDGLPALTAARDQAFILNEMALVEYKLGRGENALSLFTKTLQIHMQAAKWKNVATVLRNVAASLRQLNRLAECSATFELALALAETAESDDDVSATILSQGIIAISQGRFAEGERLLAQFHARRVPGINVYRPGEAEFWICVSRFRCGALTETDWREAYAVAVRHRNVSFQFQFLALRGEWLLAQKQPSAALDAIDEALKIANRLGTPCPEYHDLRAWALARLGRTADSRGELANGEQQLFAAEAWRVLGEREELRTSALNAYRWAWGDGPPHIHWCCLERSRALLRELGEVEPQLPEFDPGKVNPIPFEREIRNAITQSRFERRARAANARNE